MRYPDWIDEELDKFYEEYSNTADLDRSLENLNENLRERFEEVIDDMGGDN